MLTKRLDGMWVNDLGYIAAIILQWNSKDDDGNDAYKFLLNPFDQLPYVVSGNGIDNSVLVSSDMFNALVARGIARHITDEEAEVANKDGEVIETNSINSQKEVETKLQLEQKAKLKSSTADPSTPVKAFTGDEEDVIKETQPTTVKVAATKEVASLAKKGK